MSSWIPPPAGSPFSSRSGGRPSDRALCSPSLAEKQPDRASTAESIRARFETSFPAFVAHVSSLERELDDKQSLFIDEYIQGFNSRSLIGEGRTFLVERAVATPNQSTIKKAPEAIQKGQVVALKSVIVPDDAPDEPRQGWRHILLEIRALLHGPLRYHPNIMRLIGLCWGASAGSEDMYPQLVVEFAEFGTLADLQRRSATPLPFHIKQKLLYDVSKGLSVIHACDIVHGDIKRKNVLVFANPSPNTQQDRYIAKLADFGGSIVGSNRHDTSHFLSTTDLYAAPEVNEDSQILSKRQSLCDVFSFGLLVCETVVEDLSGLHPEFGARNEDSSSFVSTQPPDLTRRTSLGTPPLLTEFKRSPGFLDAAVKLIERSGVETKLPPTCTDLIRYVLQVTLPPTPDGRSLAKAQTALRGVPLNEIQGFTSRVEELNEKWLAAAALQDMQAPGKHGITVDKLGSILGAHGGIYDPQDNTPGFRPKIRSPPPVPDFVFEPEKLKRFLTWDQQSRIVGELRDLTDATKTNESDIEVAKYVAPFFLFKCYVAGFGTPFDPTKAAAVIWTAGRRAVVDSNNSDAGYEYLAASTAWRVCQGLDRIPSDLLGMLPSVFGWATLRGSWLTERDLEDAMSLLTQTQRDQVTKAYEVARSLAARWGGAPGSLPFLRRHRENGSFTLNDPAVLDQEMRTALGPDYNLSLGDYGHPTENPESHAVESGKSAVDTMFVNRSRGYGILHLAAAEGSTEALRYLISTFRLNIDLPSQSAEETPLLCACRGGKLEAAQYLLKCGAKAEGHQYGQETPLHWLPRFNKDEMPAIAKSLLAAGASVHARSGTMRAVVRRAYADWEEVLCIPTTPLGRAVILQSMDAARVLLDHGADPTIEVDGVSPLHLAAIFALPPFFRLFCDWGDAKSVRLSGFDDFDEAELLRTVHGRQIAKVDTFSLASRLMRNGPRYKSGVEEIINMFKERRDRYGIPRSKTSDSGEALCVEIRLGNRDLVEILLRAGHNPQGSPGHRPLRESTIMNDEAIFGLLQSHGAPVEPYPGWPFTLLHDFAMRPLSSPPGTNLAKKLIEAGITISDHPPLTRPLVVEALLRQRYDLANLLIKHGAQIAIPYKLGNSFSSPLINIFAELANMRSATSLNIVRRLLKTPELTDTTIGVESPSPALEHDETFPFVASHIGDPRNERTVLHMLACSAPAPKNSLESDIYLKNIEAMLQHDLEPFSPFTAKDCLDYQHHVAGTALCLAAAVRNHHLVGKLLEAGADPDLPVPDIATFTAEFSAQMRLDLKLRVGTPVDVGLGCYEAGVEALEAGKDLITMEQLEEMKQVVRVLKGKPEVSFSKEENERYTDLKRRVEKMCLQAEVSRAEEKSTFRYPPGQRVADLSTTEPLRIPDLSPEEKELFLASKIMVREMFDRQLYGMISIGELDVMIQGEENRAEVRRVNS